MSAAMNTHILRDSDLCQNVAFFLLFFVTLDSLIL